MAPYSTVFLSWKATRRLPSQRELPSGLSHPLARGRPEGIAHACAKSLPCQKTRGGTTIMSYYRSLLLAAALVIPLSARAQDVSLEKTGEPTNVAVLTTLTYTL